MPPVRLKERPSPVVVSHVCKHWRDLVIDLAPQWENLRICHTHHPEVLSTFISRSKQRPFGLYIDLPVVNLELLGTSDQVDFRDTFKVVFDNISRLYALHVQSFNQTLRIIFSNFFKNAAFSRLETFSLTQTGTDPLCNFGPVTFNPACFQTLRLERAMINCDATCLAGLTSLQLISSSGTLLDQTQLTHLTYPFIPSAPIMSQLNRLKIVGTDLTPTSPIFTPSFNTQSLLHLTLARISAFNEAAMGPIDKLFAATLNPGLLNIELIELDDHSFLLFLRHLEVQYPLVKSLVLIAVNLRLVTESFLLAFPALQNLTLIGVDPTLLMPFLGEPGCWPHLRYYRLNDRIIERPVRVPLVPASLISDSIHD